jgi:hypothetical protein
MPPLYWLIAKCAFVFLFFACLANVYWPLGPARVRAAVLDVAAVPAWPPLASAFTATVGYTSRAFVSGRCAQSMSRMFPLRQ